MLAFSYCYHGSVDETVVVSGPDGQTLARPGNVGPAADPAITTRVAEFNDLASVERALAHGDVAVVITEPALTNIGIVLPEPGFLEGLRELCTRYGALLLIDETHTFSRRPGRHDPAATALQPDIFVIGKSIAGGIPIGAYGITAAGGRPVDRPPATPTSSTSAGSAARSPATRCRWRRTRPPSRRCSPTTAFAAMIAAGRPGSPTACSGCSTATTCPWSVSQLGRPGRVPLRPPGPANGHASPRRPATTTSTSTCTCTRSTAAS